jgi:exodeoxyribonuclease V gamma subunit
MTLHVHRSTRVEDLVGALNRSLREGWPADPLTPVPIVVGSSGMGRWLRHELATRARSAALLDFLFPRNAFDATAAWLLKAPAQEAEPDEVFWNMRGRALDAWSGPRLVGRVLASLRAQLAMPEFAAVRRYLGASLEEGSKASRLETEPVGAREVAFATLVARTVERLHYDRPHDALAWSRDPGSAPEDMRWVARLLERLEREAELPGVLDATLPSPAAALARLDALPIRPRPRTLHVFGLSTLRPGDKLRIRVIARHLDVHLYLLVPSTAWWGDLRTKREQVRELRKRLETEGYDSIGREELTELFSPNELLASHGGPSRDLQLWLEDADYIDHECPRENVNPKAESSAAPSLLRELQHWVDRADPTPQPEELPWREHSGRASIRVHACHGPLRQCEVLRDELLRRFSADPTLEPRHVLVMTPDVPTYAPLVAAVFSRTAQGAASAEGEGGSRTPNAPRAPAIPVQIADLGLSATNPLADALLRVLALTEERVTTAAVLDLLELAPVRARFLLDDEDLVDVRDMLVGSGARWAWDQDDRARFEQPRLDQNTLRFGLERLALGVLMTDDSELDVLAPTSELGPGAPFEVTSRERVERFGKLASFIDTLDSVRQTLLHPATAEAWHARLCHAMHALTRVEDDLAWQRVQVEDALRERLLQTTDTPLTFERGALEALVAEAFEVQARGDRPITGAVTVCAMEPMRSVPFRVIAMLGLDDRAFPRASTDAAWSPFSSPRPGEHDRRTLDRHLFLESLLCARDALLLFGTGFEPRRGQEVPLSVVATELSELLARGTGMHTSHWPKGAHPLQPWSEQAFLAPAHEGTSIERDALPFDPVWFACRGARLSAEAKEALSTEASQAAPHTWPIDRTAPTALTASALAIGLVNGACTLLRDRLGIKLSKKAVEIPSREPLELDALDGWSLRDRILAVLDEADELHPNTKQSTLTAFEQRLRAEGILPLHAGGHGVLVELERDATDLFERAREAGTRLPRVVASVVVDGLRLSAVASDVRSLRESGGARDILVKTASNAPNEKTLLSSWVTLLVMRAAGHDFDAIRILGTAGERRLVAPTAATPKDAQVALKTLVSAYFECRKRPLPLFPSLSFKLVQTHQASPDLELAALLERCSAQWNGSPHEAGTRHDRWVSTLYPDLDLSDLAEIPDVLEWAVTVWGPLATELAPRPRASRKSKSAEKDKAP